MADIKITLKSNIPQLIAQLSDTVKQAQESKAKEILSDAQSICPVDTGRLRASGYEKTSVETPIIHSEVGFTAPYAAYVEAHKSYLRDSYIKGEQEVVDTVKAKIKDLAGRLSNV